MKSRALFGKRILVTRAKNQSTGLSMLLKKKGAKVIEIPTIEIEPLPLSPGGKEQLRKIYFYDWLVFSSANAVEIFMSRLSKMGGRKKLKSIKIACVGESTAKELRANCIKVDLVPKDYRQEGLAKSFGKVEVKGKRFLIAGAKEGRKVLEKSLEKKGAMVDSLPLYENRMPSNAGPRLRELMTEKDKPELAIFASSSAANNFYGLFTSAQSRLARRIPTAVIGPVTAATVRKWGGKIVAQPSKYTLPALVSAIERWASQLENS